MASGFFALFDDIATLMQDVASMSKVATKKTAGILGDDLAVNAEQASGFVSERELPVIWAIMKGSFLNKLIILPIIFLLSAFLPWSIAPLLMLGGAFLAFEGAEKIFELFFHKKELKSSEESEKVIVTDIDAFEKQRIKSAIFIDFILSLEIVLIALSAVEDQILKVQIFAVTITAIIATIGVYGIVALLVRMDDFGYKLMQKSKKNNGFIYKIGQVLVKSMPIIIKSLTVIGTIAMLLVAGGIYMHHFEFLHHVFEKWPIIFGEFIVGLLLGIIVFGIIFLFQKLFNFVQTQKEE